MKRLLLAGMGMVLAVALAGCIGGGDGARNIFASIMSNPSVDGDVAYDPVAVSYTYSHASATGSVWVGIDDGALNTPEYAGLLDFSLNGSTGWDDVPSWATIVSADIEIFVTGVSYGSPVTVFLDLVDITGSSSTDFNSAYLATRSVNFFTVDQNNYVRIDVTPLMLEAQRLGRPHLQVRYRLDPAAIGGLVQIDDRSAFRSTRPLLTVEYF